MMQYRFLFPVLTLMLLSGCVATPEQIAAAKQQQQQEDFNTCVGYGLRPGSESFGNCRLQLDLARQQRYNNYYYDPYPRFHYGYYHFR
jgi:hypothetical protein